MTKKERREMKRAAKVALRKHYFVLLFIGLICVIIGAQSAYNNPFKNKSKITLNAGEETSVISDYTLDDVIFDILEDRVESGDEQAKKLVEQYQANSSDTSSFGRRRGVLASVVNNVSSGKIFIMILLGLHSMTKSKIAGGAIFITGALIIYVLYRCIFVNLCSISYHRMMLESRTYDDVPLSNALSVIGTNKWLNACLVMTVKSFFQFLWSMTIIGGLIKMYSYAMVPFIVAENPSVKPLKAIKLSRDMMKGHKWEMFKLDVTMLGWMILSFFTFGISELVYSMPYRILVYSNYYTRLRTLAKENNILNAQKLNDDLLFEKAPLDTVRAAYSDILEEEARLSNIHIELSGIQRFFANWFGFWVGSTVEKNEYQAYENDVNNLRHEKAIVEGNAYPYRINHHYATRKDKAKGISFIRTYSIWSLLSMFFAFSCVGWLWEVSLSLISTGRFVNRGMLHGPWLPIYGSGIILIMLLAAHFRKNPILEFIVSVTLCGILEYYTAYHMWIQFHKKWWDYSGYFLNLHGRICAEGLLVFGIGGLTIVYLVAPVYDALISRVSTKILIPILVVFMGLYAFDWSYSQKHPNEGAGVTDTTKVVEELPDTCAYVEPDVRYFIQN